MDLKTKAIKSTAWYIGTRVWMQALSWGVTLVLARLLAPEDYGLFAMAFTVITFMELFQEFGLGVSIVQRQNLSKAQINSIFWLLFAVSVVIVAIMFLGAGFAARFYNEPRLVWIVPILSVTFLFSSLGVVPYSVLTKEIDFRGRSLAEASGVVTSSGISLALAYVGAGVWALVFGHLARAAVRTLGMFISSKWVPGFQMSFAEMREILKFSLRIAGASTLGTLSDTINTAIVGRFLGGYNLGLYSMANTLGQNNPLHRLSTGVINQLSLPVFSKLQHETASLKEYFLKITKYLAAISLPMQVGMALVAHDLILVLLSEKWLPTAGLIQVFALGGMFHIVTLPSFPLLTARARANVNFRFAWVSALSITAVYLVGAQWGLRGIAIGWVVVFPLLRIYLLWLGLREIDVSLRTYVQNIITPLVATVVMTLVLAVARTLTQQFTPVERFLVNISLGAGTYLFFLLLIDKKLTNEFKTIARELLTPSAARQTSRA
jgi:teichuronic acid exporter